MIKLPAKFFSLSTLFAVNLSLFFLTLQASHAQSTTSSTPAVSLAATPKASQAALSLHTDVAQMHSTLAESTYRMSHSIDDFAEWVLSLERIVEIECMSKLPRTLDYSARELSQKCTESIAQLSNIDPGNPTAICAKNGIRSELCTSAWNTVTSATFSNSSQSSERPATDAAMLELEQKLAESSNSRAITNLRNQIAAQEQATETRDDPKQKLKILELYRKLLAATCTATKLDLKPLLSATEIRTGGMPQLGEDDTSELSLEKGRAPRATPTPTTFDGQTFRRSRMILERCDATLRNLQSIDAKSPWNACYRFGFYSVQCLKARLAYMQPESKNGASGSGSRQKDSDIGKF